MTIGGGINRGDVTAGGFTADLQGLKGLAEFANDRAEDVQRVVSSLQKLPEANEDSLGDGGGDGPLGPLGVLVGAGGVVGAYNSFFGAWTDELNIIASSLEEISQKFKDTAANYRTTDVHWSHNFESIDP